MLSRRARSHTDFWAKRIARIAPIAWMSIVWMIPVNLINIFLIYDSGQYYFGAPAYGLGWTFQLLCTFFAVQSYLPREFLNLIHADMITNTQFNSVLWTVCVQFLFYWTFPALMVRIIGGIFDQCMSHASVDSRATFERSEFCHDCPTIRSPLVLKEEIEWQALNHLLLRDR